ncbi:MAG: hypothetical protein K2H67_03750 [Treponemataceae bacterium]|nr:hypothetical protein [Treponemataceae bacterium]
MPSEVSDVFAQVGKVPSETADGLTAFGGNEFGAQNSFPTNCGIEFVAQDLSMRPCFDNQPSLAL